MPYTTPQPLIDRFGPQLVQTLALLLMAGIAAADYATGYALRLSFFYLIPIALATWSSGMFTGVGVALTSCLLWLFSFQSEHFYLHQGFYLWEATVMFCGFLAVVWLIARLRRALSQADERFMRVLEEMHAAVYVADERRDEIIYANAGMLRMANTPAGLKPGAFEQQFLPEADTVDPQPKSVAVASSAAASGFSARTIKDQCTGRWYLMQSGPIPWGSNPDVKLKVLTDITAQKETELLREKHFEVMHQAARHTALAEIASTLAHEINQPLMVIATYTDACQRLLERDQFDRVEVSSALQKCRAQAVRAASIIERLREFIRQRQYHPVPCEAKSVMTESIEMMRPLLNDARITVEVTIAPTHDPAELVFVADRILLIQVLVNLIRNAIDAMRDTVPASRSITMAVDRLTTGEGGIRFSVADRGPGLGAIAAEALFAPFFTTKADGLGLGLAISRSIAETHGGRLWANSRPGPDGGAIFYLSIPAAPITP